MVIIRKITLNFTGCSWSHYSYFFIHYSYSLSLRFTSLVTLLRLFSLAYLAKPLNVNFPINWINSITIYCNIYFQKKPPEAFCKKKVFLEISQNSQENTCTRVSFLIKLQAEAYEIIKTIILSYCQTYCHKCIYIVNFQKIFGTWLISRNPSLVSTKLEKIISEKVTSFEGYRFQLIEDLPMHQENCEKFKYNTRKNYFKYYPCQHLFIQSQ